MIFFNQCKSSFYAVLVASTMLLAACGGGGGGGGGGAIPPKLSFDPAIDGTTLDSSSADVGIVFEAGVDPDSLSVLLNGVEVESVFATTAVGATASMYSLSSALVDGSNTIVADVANSPSITATFTYDAKPEIIHTSYSSGAVNGMVRLVDLQSALLNSVSMNVVGKNFSLGGITLPLPRTNVATPDYTMTVADADGDTDTADFVVPGTNLKSAIALQLNNGAFTVVNSWVAELLGKKLDINSSGLLPYSYPRGNEFSADVCLVIPGNANNGNNYICDLTVNSVAFSANPTVTSEVVADADPNNDQNYRIKITATFAQVDIGFKIDAYSATDPYPAQGTLTSTISYPNVALTVYVDVDYVAGKVINLSLPGPIGSESAAFALSADLVNVTAFNCTISSCAIPSPQVTLQANLRLKQSGVIIPSMVDVLQQRLPPYIDPALAELSPNDGSKVIPISGLVNPIRFDYSGSDISEAKDNVGGFITLGTSIYAEEVDSLTFNPVIGSFFKPLSAAIITGRNISPTAQVGIALSENMINQLLMSFYQSGLMSGKSVNMTVADLGALGDKMVLQSLGLIQATDPVIITPELLALPHARFVAGGLEVVMDNFNLNIVIQSTGMGLLDSDMLVDVKARLNYGLDPVTKLPGANVSPADLSVRVVSLTGAAAAGVTKETAQSGILGFLAGYIQQLSGQVMQSSTFTFDLKGLGLQEEAWLVLQTLAVDADEQYVLVTADFTDIAPVGGVQALFKIQLTDSTIIP